MANTSFNGPVRSQKGFQQINKADSTGIITSRFLGTKPDLTSLTATVVATSTPLTYTANVITCAGSDVYRTGSKVESRATGTVQTISTSLATNTILTYTPASAATNSLTHGCYLYFTCFEKGTWNFAFDLSTANDADTGAAAWS